MNFYFQDGNVAEDSNVPALRNGVLVDSLDGVTNGYYTFEAGECAHESSYEVQMGGEFELVKNEDAQDLDISHILLPEVTAEDTMNFIKQYGWYILLVIVIILLIIFFKKRKKHQ
ncbi:hypothetical protein KKG31_02395 [Patescibacteria group bacterium]|nr:hypothetical protein [Patescibacteria group bacterium]MBU1758020.1 hypothetical protein [Patescibacteria group bacterium]